METFAEEQGEPIGKVYYDVRKLVTSRAYADVLEAIGVPGSFVNDTRKNKTLRRIHELLWPALKSFHGSLQNWMQTWTTGLANPQMAFTIMAMAQSGMSGATMPVGIMAPPETEGLRDEAESFNDTINKIFAGPGIPVARALAADAGRIKSVLEQDDLPAALGATTRDIMLKSLGVNVDSNYVRMERNVIRYTLAIMELPNQTSGNEELAYLGAMYQLGQQIPWDRLSGQEFVPVSKNSRRKRGGSDDDTEEDEPVGAGFRTIGRN